MSPTFALAKDCRRSWQAESCTLVPQPWAVIFWHLSGSSPSPTVWGAREDPGEGGYRHRLPPVSPVRGWGPPGRGWSGRSKGTGCSSQDTHQILPFPLNNLRQSPEGCVTCPCAHNYQPASHSKPVHFIPVKCKRFYLLHPTLKS